MSGKHTSWSGSFRVGEQDHAGLAVLDELRETRLGPLVGLNLAAEAGEVNGIADLGNTTDCGGWSLSGLFPVGFAGHGLLDGFDLFNNGLLCLGDLAFGRGLLLLGRAHGGGRGCLALAELNHGDCGGRGWSQSL